MRDSFEHRRWPPVGDPRRAEWEVHEIQCLATHFASLNALKSFDLEEAQHEWSRLKREFHDVPFFSLPYKKFWEHVSRHYDNTHGYRNVNIIARLSCLMLPDSSICERGFAAYGRIHTAKGEPQGEYRPKRPLV
jgi:hypothetical protein